MKVEEDEHRHKVDSMYELLGQLEKKYYLDDLFNSKLFSNLCEFHLVPICGDKFIFINVFNLIPNLFEIKITNYKIGCYRLSRRHALWKSENRLHYCRRELTYILAPTRNRCDIAKIANWEI